MGGVPEHWVLHRAPQLAWHWDIQVVMSPDDEQAPEQLPWQVPVQSALQLKLPGLAEHLPEQPPSQEAEHMGNMTVQPPEQLASSCAEHANCTFETEHATSHDALASTVQVSFPSKTAPPQSDKISARAAPAANVTMAPNATARSEDQRNMEDLLKSNCP
jgi:hypothetical protein